MKALKRFSTLRKVVRLSLFLAGFFVVYFVFLTLLDTEERSEDGLVELLYSENIPRNYDVDDGMYIGQPLSYEIVRNYRTFGLKENVRNDDICLFTQFSADRLDAFIKLALSWDSYISAALYVEEENQVDFIMEQLAYKLLSHPNDNIRIDISLLYSYAIKKPQNTSFHPYDLLYPINALRNLALKQCKSMYAFSLDVDFTVSDGAHDMIKSHLHLLSDSESPLALVVPVFEWIFEREIMPSKFDFKAFQIHCGTGRIIPFHSKRFARNRYLKDDLKKWCTGVSTELKHLKITRVQNLTDYTKWISASEVYAIDKKPNVLDLYYEPYFVGRSDLIPLFSESFRGYGFNKRANAMAMQYAGFTFMVIPKVFAVHRFHPSSAWRRLLKQQDIIKKTLGRTFDVYKLELKNSKRYKNQLKRD